MGRINPFIKYKKQICFQFEKKYLSDENEAKLWLEKELLNKRSKSSQMILSCLRDKGYNV